ncbi:hypothetical protein [Hydrogenophaga sp.]|uniref:hypothetical protein n=1 Tax=Hydrogenophaga sp. TaxID=1904254 RepID=UPI00271DC22C|nr:hypothetical protein [Hydrogenophaga sp.]MDO8905879.1 hypothetical protein [Hydrogenophaga sp.]
MKQPRVASRHPLKGAALAVRQSRPGGATGLDRFTHRGRALRGETTETVSKFLLIFSACRNKGLRQ